MNRILLHCAFVFALYILYVNTERPPTTTLHKFFSHTKIKRDMQRNVVNQMDGFVCIANAPDPNCKQYSYNIIVANVNWFENCFGIQNKNKACKKYSSVAHSQNTKIYRIQIVRNCNSMITCQKVGAQRSSFPSFIFFFIFSRFFIF